MTVGCTFLTPAVQRECERVVPDLNAINPQDAADHYIFSNQLKQLQHENALSYMYSIFLTKMQELKQ